MQAINRAVRGIAIVGANGSGKTTLGKRLAELTGYTHMDIEDYYFHESAIPYARPRAREEALKLLIADINKCDKFILSAVNCDFGNNINSAYDCIIYIDAPPDIRLERVMRRSYEKFGARVLEGGDMYAQETRFYDFVKTRTMDETNQWISSMQCPVIHVDGTKSNAYDLARALNLLQITGRIEL